MSTEIIFSWLELMTRTDKLWNAVNLTFGSQINLAN